MNERRRAEEIFEAALVVRPTERAALVAAAAAGDAAVLRAVHALLAAHEREGGILDVDARALLAPQDDVPERLGVYRVLREIGRGGMGVVYEAERDDGQFRRRVAIKILRAGDDRSLHQRVLAERQILAGLDHPNIARLLDGGVTADGRPYLVMEHVAGLPIDVFCDRMRLDVRERLRLFIDAARAVAFAHHNLVVHRDLKPSNILVSADGVVKLLDFGVAKMLNATLGGMASPTLPGHFALTPEYASPEQLRGESLTTQSDVFALGALLYELLTGRRAFAATGLVALIHAVCEDDVVPPSATVVADAVQPSLDGSRRVVEATAAARARQATPQRMARELRGDLDAIVLQALRREPRHRYGSAELLARDIENFLDGMPVAAHRRGRVYALGKFVRRHRVSAAAVLLAVLSLLGGTTTALWQAREARAQRDAAESARAESDQVTEFLIELFEAGAPGSIITDAVTARDLVRRGAGRIGDLTDQPRVQTRLLTVLGRVHEHLGEYEEGQRLTQRALAIQGDRVSQPADDAAQLLLQHGILQRRRAQYDSAEATFLRARDLLATAPDASAVMKGQVLNQLASIAIYRAELPEAERRARAALDVLVAELGETHRLSVNALTYLGAVQWRRGLPEAEQNFRRAIELRPLAVGSTRGEAMTDRMQLAEMLLTERRSLDEADRIFRDALATMRPNEPSEFGHTVWSRGSLAMILEERGDFAGARRLLEEVLELHRNAYGADHPVVGASYSGLARHLVRAGQLDEAEPLLDRASAIQLATFGTEHPSYAAALANRAYLLAARGELAAADSITAHVIQLNATHYARRAIPQIEQIVFRAQLRTRMGDYALAETLINDALERATAMVTERNRIMREIHSTFANLYSTWGRTADAERHRALIAGR